MFSRPQNPIVPTSDPAPPAPDDHSAAHCGEDSNGRGWTLAVDCSRRTGSLAIAHGNTILATTKLPGEVRSTAAMVPAIDELYGRLTIDNPADRTAVIAVAVGPGSFTGLRIAVTVAKTLGYAWSRPVVAIDSLAAIAAAALDSGHADRSDDPVWRCEVLLNAYRGQSYGGVFSADYLRRDSIHQTDHTAVHFGSQTSVRFATNDTDATANKTAATANNTAATGNADRDSGQPLITDVKGLLSTIDIESLCPAIGVATLAAIVGGGVDAMTILPRYIKPSAAEEQRSASP